MTSPTPIASYRVEGATWTLTFTDEVLRLLEGQIQTGWATKESVGQLYCKDLTVSDIVIGHATVLPKTRASYSGVQFKPEVAARERAVLFEEGWHCVGLWHSHPEPFPEPSITDGMLAKDHAKAAATHLNGLVFAILGNRSPPVGLGVWLHDGNTFFRANWCRQAGAAEPQQPKSTSKRVEKQ